MSTGLLRRETGYPPGLTPGTDV